jgi:hypothetical protein
MLIQKINFVLTYLYDKIPFLRKKSAKPFSAQEHTISLNTPLGKSSRYWDFIAVDILKFLLTLPKT